MEERARPRTPWVRLSISALFILGLVALYWLRPDAAYAVHIYPMWVWGGALLLPWLTRKPKAIWRWAAASLAVWVIALFSVGEPAPAELLPASASPVGDVRVVSINASAGMTEAVAEALSLNPDIILVQESPGESDLLGLAPDWSLVPGPDAAILSRWPIETVAVESDHVIGLIDADGRMLRVVSLRLSPPVLRFDLWRPQAWASYSDDIGRKREELRQVAPQGPFDLVGGDFNTPNHRMIGGIFPEMREAKTAIRGWGSTATNYSPLVRIDQIWSGDALEPAKAFTVRSKFSDHRLSVADYRWTGP